MTDEHKLGELYNYISEYDYQKHTPEDETESWEYGFDDETQFVVLKAKLKLINEYMKLAKQMGVK